MGSRIRKAVITIDRISAWALIPLMVIFFFSGFSIAGWYGFESLLEQQQAYYLHANLSLPLLAFFLIHTSIRISFVIRRMRRIHESAYKENE